MSERTRRLTPVDVYRRLWRGADAPDLKAFVAGLPALTPDDILDLVETDRTERWRRGDRVRAERYLKDFPALRRDVEATLVVIYGEYYLRKDLGETPSLMDFVARFPNHARRLRDQIMWHEAIETSPLGGPGPPVIPGLVVGDLLGRGGMSTVYRATDAGACGPVAVKVLDPGQIQSLLRVARFRREVSSLMRLKHPNIVAAYRTGDAQGVPFLVMEYCAAGPLSAYLRKHRLAPAVAADVAWNLAKAVEYAHQEGVIHRDIKPANVLLSLTRDFAATPAPKPDSGEHPALVAGAFPFIPKLSDFGLAKCLIGTEVGLTATRESLGTPCYMAPELTTGARDADARTDVYGLGGLLYELLTARPPFVASSPMEVLRMVREEAPVPPAALNPTVPERLQAVCLRCLAKDPAARYAGAGEVALALDLAATRNDQ